MRQASGRAVAAVLTVLCAAATAGALAGCGAQAASSRPASGVISPAGTPAAVSGAGAGAGAPAVTDPAGAGVDSDLNAVDGQLSGLDSALAQATQSPSDGG